MAMMVLVPIFRQLPYSKDENGHHGKGFVVVACSDLATFYNRKHTLL